MQQADTYYGVFQLPARGPWPGPDAFRARNSKTLAYHAPPRPRRCGDWPLESTVPDWEPSLLTRTAWHGCTTGYVLLISFQFPSWTRCAQTQMLGSHSSTTRQRMPRASHLAEPQGSRRNTFQVPPTVAYRDTCALLFLPGQRAMKPPQWRGTSGSVPWLAMPKGPHNAMPGKWTRPRRRAETWRSGPTRFTWPPSAGRRGHAAGSRPKQSGAAERMIRGPASAAFRSAAAAGVCCPRIEWWRPSNFGQVSQIRLCPPATFMVVHRRAPGRNKGLV